MTGDELAALRFRLRLSQRELAEQLGLHPNSVARLERGEFAMSRTVDRLLRLLARQRRR